MHSQQTLDDFVARSRAEQLAWLGAQIVSCRAVILDGVGPYGTSLPDSGPPQKRLES